MRSDHATVAHIMIAFSARFLLSFTQAVIMDGCARWMAMAIVMAVVMDMDVDFYGWMGWYFL